MKLLTGTFELTDEEFEQFRSIIYKSIGIHLSEKKRSLLVSRLSRRLRALNLNTFSQYYRYLQKSPDSKNELMHMINRITTNKTDFFREIQHFDFLKKELFPYIIEKAENGDRSRTVRIWSAGCSSGEEPYSIAMTIADTFKDYMGWDIKILATDIDTEVLAKAINGIYPVQSIDAVPKEYLIRFFTRQDNNYRVKQGIKSMIVFRKLNLMQPVFPIKRPFDIIFCRNVIIYFDIETKTELMKKFHHYLKDSGYIFLGHSESLMHMKAEFKYIQNTVYRKI